MQFLVSNSSIDNYLSNTSLISQQRTCQRKRHEFSENLNNSDINAGRKSCLSLCCLYIYHLFVHKVQSRIKTQMNQTKRRE